MQTLDVKKTSTELAKIPAGLEVFEQKKAELLALIEEGKDLTIIDHTDKKGYEAVKAHRIKIKNFRIPVEKEGKALRDILNPVVKEISSKEKEISVPASTEEKRFQDMEDNYEAALERIRKEKEEEEARVLNERVQKLAAYGHAHDTIELKLMTEEQFTARLMEAKADYDREQARIAEEAKIAAEKAAEEERRRKEEEARLKAEREELERKQKEQEAKEEAFRAEQEKIRKEQEDREKKIREEQEAIAKAKQKQEEEERLKKAREEAAEEARKDAEAKAKREAEEKAEAERRAEEERKRQESLRPDKERLAMWAEEIRGFGGPILSDTAANEIKKKAIADLVKVAKFIESGIENI